jgi:Domain of unknown function (DUF4345)
MRIPRLVLWLVAVGFIVVGLAYTVWPLPMGRLTEIPLPTPTARIDFAATYGGFQLGFGVFLLMCARRPAWLQVGLWAAAASLLGFGIVRLLSLFLAPGPPQAIVYQSLALELGGAALSVWAIHRAGAEISESAD